MSLKFFFPNSLYFWIFPNSLKSRENGIFEVYWFYILLSCEKSFSGTLGL